MTELSDELLLAYVDGQLAHKKREAIDRVLKHDGEAVLRVDALRQAQQKLESAFDEMLRNEWAEIEARPDDRALLDYEALARKYARWSRGRIAAAGLAFLALGAAMGYTAARLDLAGWLRPVVSAMIAGG